MAKKKTKPSSKKPKGKNVSGKAAWNAPAGVEGSSTHDRQFEAPPNKHIAGIASEHVGGKAGQMTYAQRSHQGLNKGCDFGSCTIPNRRLNPRNAQDAKLIAKGMDMLHINKNNPSCARGNIDKSKYDDNYNDIDWGKDKKNTDKNGVRKPKKTRKVYK